MSETEIQIKEHREKVQKNIEIIIKELKKRAENHDLSKLEEPEISGWKEMDKEPRYPYGSKEYNEKQERYKWLFEEHWRKNRHHPEYFQNFFCEMNLIDILEMICDWASYDYMTTDEAIDLIEKQVNRFGVSDLLKYLILNTYIEYFVVTDEEKLSLREDERFKNLIDWKNIDLKALKKFH